MKIVLFSRLKSIDRYESTEFKAGGYKWKLVVFPNGNKMHNVDDHISLYLEMCGDKGIDPMCIVTVDYKFFLLNRHWKNYLVLKDANKEMKKYCIYQTIVGGLADFDRFIPLEDFSDAFNGYLVEDTCEFGAEVFISIRKRKGARELREYVNLNTFAYKHVRMVPIFSKLYDGFTEKKQVKC
jgi:speckle-type POZ protein